MLAPDLGAGGTVSFTRRVGSVASATKPLQQMLAGRLQPSCRRALLGTRLACYTPNECSRAKGGLTFVRDDRRVRTRPRVPSRDAIVERFHISESRSLGITGRVGPPKTLTLRGTEDRSRSLYTRVSADVVNYPPLSTHREPWLKTS
jgi:hypothetical protein